MKYLLIYLTGFITGIIIYNFFRWLNRKWKRMLGVPGE